MALPRSGPSWWVINGPVGGSRLNQGFQIVQALSKPPNFAAGPFATRAEAQAWINNAGTSNTAPTGGSTIPNPLTAIQGWLTSIGGMIASGIEQGIVSSLQDLWGVIIGPVEVVLGFIVLAFVLVVYFKDDVMAGIGLLGSLSMAAGA
jgi:hypothetical protein